MRLDSYIEWKSSNNTYLNIIEIFFFQLEDYQIGKFSNNIDLRKQDFLSEENSLLRNKNIHGRQTGWSGYLNHSLPNSWGSVHIYRTFSIIVDLFYRAYSIVNLLTYFRAFLNIFLNIITDLCRVYIIIPINIGLRIKRVCF